MQICKALFGASFFIACLAAQSTIGGGIQSGLGGGSGASPVQSVNGQTGAVSVPPNISNASIKFVDPVNGLDTNGGTSWSDAKKTIYGAQQAWPVNGTLGSGGYHYGSLFMAPGTTNETHTLEFNAQQRWYCYGTGMDSVASGCTVKLANGENIPLASYTADFASAGGYAHFLQVEGFTFDCNAANNTGTSDCVAIYNGGFSNAFRNVLLKNSNGYCLTLERSTINFGSEHMNFADCAGGAIHLHDTAGLNHTVIQDTQIDRSGSSPIVIEQTTASSQEDFVNFIGLKVESFTTGNSYYSGTTGTHVHVIDFKPRTAINGNSMVIKIDGGWAANTNSTGTSAFYEENNAGPGARWLVKGYTATGYTQGFYSAKTGQSSQQVFMADATFVDTSLAYNTTPAVETTNFFASQSSGIGTALPNNFNAYPNVPGTNFQVVDTAGNVARVGVTATPSGSGLGTGPGYYWINKSLSAGLQNWNMESDSTGINLLLFPTANFSGTPTVAANWTGNGLTVPALIDTGLISAASLATDSNGKLISGAPPCTLTTYTVAYNDTALTGVSSATPTKTLLTLPSTSTRICAIEISGTASFTGVANLTAATLRLQSSASTPLAYSPNQDIFGTVGPTTNNYWSDAGNTADRSALGVVAAFTFTCSSGSCFSSGLTSGNVTVVVGTRAAGY